MTTCPTRVGIRGFFEDFDFLSNFHPSTFVLGEKEYATVEHFFQAKKAITDYQHEQIRNAATPGLAKRLGRKVTLRPDWLSIRDEVMRIAVDAKFRQNAGLKVLLMCTEDSYLEETNYWGDKYWGVCNGEGKNVLGNILMDLRTTFKMEVFHGD